MKQSELLFYEIMKYPVPQDKDFFSTEKKEHIPQEKKGDFSREEKNPLMDEYLEYIEKHQNIFKSLPWVKSIYLCNSITFNQLHPGSDIDLFIIVKKGCLRRARLASALIFFFAGLKRTKSRITKKYCLSFYITEDAQNIYNISLPKTDIYLAYRLAHLVPLYQEQKEESNIYQYNSRISALLPNFPKRHTIVLGNHIIEGNSKIKTIIEKYSRGILGRIVEYLIKTLRIPILIYKTKKLKEHGANIVFNDSMLKFHQDKRQKISLLYRSKNPNSQKQ